VRALLRRCLQKDKDRRFRDIGDARIEIEEALADAASHTTPPEPIAAAGGSIAGRGVRPRHILLAGLAGALVAIIATLAVWNLRSLPAPAPLAISRFTIALAPGQQFGDLQFPQVAISPSGTDLAYVARSGDSPPQIFIRALDSLEARLLLGTEGAYEPFFSPDGQWIGFFAQGKCEKYLLTAVFRRACVTHRLAKAGVGEQMT
jgi:WD40 repeat protein